MNQKQLIEKILSGKIFIYPTDTLYGLGCNAMNLASVARIREIKGRDAKPLSVIAPNFDWIYDNFIVSFDIKKYLPGPYTLLLKKKEPEFMNHISSNDRIGIRIPNHPFCLKIQKASVPFVTTSVNLSGQPSAINIENMPQEIVSKVDEIIENKDIMLCKPSTLILDDQEVKRN